MLSEIILELCDINERVKSKAISEVICELGQYQNEILEVFIDKILTNNEKFVILRNRLNEDIEYFIDSNEIDRSELDEY